MTNESKKLKKIAGYAALKYILPNSIIGVGTGSTVGYFINALSTLKNKIQGAVSSSEDSTRKLQALGIAVFDLNEVESIQLYVDGADEINTDMQMIKGGGGALTREKIVASVAEKFLCIVDESKQVRVLGKFPLPVEVIPMARNAVIKCLTQMGGVPKIRKTFTTDNGNIILDVYGIRILNPVELEFKINNIPGVVGVGLFASRSADIKLVSTPEGIRITKKFHTLQVMSNFKS